MIMSKSGLRKDEERGRKPVADATPLVRCNGCCCILPRVAAARSDQGATETRHYMLGPPGVSRLRPGGRGTCHLRWDCRGDSERAFLYNRQNGSQLYFSTLNSSLKPLIMFCNFCFTQYTRCPLRSFWD